MVGSGYHIALSREHAKRVFALNDDVNLPPLIEEFKNDKTLQANSQVHDCKRTWDPIHRCLTDGTLDPEGGDFPLNQVILGGKKLHIGDDYIDVVVRPEQLAIRLDGAGEGIVRGIEYFGHDQLVEVDLAGGHRVRSRLGSARVLVPGDRVALAVTGEVLVFPMADARDAPAEVSDDPTRSVAAG